MILIMDNTTNTELIWAKAEKIINQGIYVAWIILIALALYMLFTGNV